MATVVARTPFTKLKAGGASGSITLVQPAQAGNKLIIHCAGGAIASFTGAVKRTTYTSGNAQDVSISDLTAAGGETSIAYTLNGAENIGGVIEEVADLGAYIGVANAATGATPATATDYRVAPATDLTVASGLGVAFAMFAVKATAASRPFNGVNQFRGLGPHGRLIEQGANQPGSDEQFIWAAGVADVSTTTKYPATASAGVHRLTSQFTNPGGDPAFGCAVLYANGNSTLINPTVNAIARENSLPGTYQGNWFGGSAQTGTIAGYTDKTSYAPGDTVNFKVDSGNNAFRVEIYRLGYYGWETLAARNVVGNGSHVTGTPAVQSAPSVDGTYGSTSCAWSTTATYAIPSDATPGVYYVLYRRTDDPTKFASGHFVVRSASVTGKVVVVVPDFSYQAYNAWGATSDNGSFSGTITGRSLYRLGSDGVTANFAHRGYAVSFDRPYSTQSGNPNSYLFDGDQPWICWAEAQGYDLAYLSDVDLELNPNALLGAGLVVMLGHSEYWTTNVYNAYTNAVNAGINMYVYGANIALWHTRFAAGDTAKRLMICYKDSGTKDTAAGFTGTGYDPVSYTGTWRDSRTVPGEVNNSDIRRENALLGQLFRVSGPIVGRGAKVPEAAKTLPIWRNSAPIQALTAGQEYTTAVDVIGDELDLPDGSAGQPDNIVLLNPHNQASFSSGANANGSVYTTVTGTVIASATLYRRPSGALVFHTGSWRYWWGCSRWAKNELAGPQGVINVAWQSAQLAILYDLGAVPTAVRAMQPGTDTAPTDPATGAPGGGRDNIARAYGLTVPLAGNNMLLVFE
ncbi:MAG: hypothetical protein QOF58_8182 [Pseudonocardiales bacterium]|nr:hypothetical protein [Pseudonocardiales bacterium]